MLLILVFKTSNSLANAYGVAVTGAMAVTTIIWGAFMFSRRDVPKWRTALIIAGLLSLDLSLFASCLTKFFQGGYMPFGIALVIMGVMFSWYRGRELLGNMMTRGIVSTEQLGKDLEASDLVRVGGSRVFLSRESTPEHSVASILEFHRRTKDISENIVILMLPSTWANPHQVAGIPEVKKHEGGLWEITVPHGYMVDADAPGALRAAVTASGGEFSFDPNDVFFIFPKEYLAACSCYLPRWQKRTYNFLARNVGIHVNLMRIPPKILIGYLAYIELKCPARVCCKDSL